MWYRTKYGGVNVSLGINEKCTAAEEVLQRLFLGHNLLNFPIYVSEGPKGQSIEMNSYAMISVQVSGGRNAGWLEETRLSHQCKYFTGVLLKQ